MRRLKATAGAYLQRLPWEVIELAKQQNSKSSKGLTTAILVVVSLIFAASWASIAEASSKKVTVKIAASVPQTATAPATAASVSRVDCRIGDSHTWSGLGGDPVWPGGINVVGQLSVVVKSAAGQRALTCIGLNQAERAAVTSQIDKATSCTMKWGQVFPAMSFHSDGASVDRPTQFVDPRYKKAGGAPAFCLTVKVKEGGSIVTISILWPFKCVNAALVSRTTTTPHKATPPKTPPAKASGCPKGYSGKRPFCHKRQPAAPGTTIIITGPCSTVTVGNNNKVITNQCNTTIIVVWVQCGIVQIPIQGQTVNEAVANAQNWAKVNCSTATMSPPVTVPPGGSTPPPAICISNCHPVIPPCTTLACQPVCTGTPEQCKPKDGTLGPGIGTPGQPGGPSPGGSPGTPMCIDSSGSSVPGTPDPSTGLCPGATPTQTGPPASPGPPIPLPEMCIDPVTMLSRNMLPGETKDQYGYCS